MRSLRELPNYNPLEEKVAKFVEAWKFKTRNNADHAIYIISKFPKLGDTENYVITIFTPEGSLIHNESGFYSVTECKDLCARHYYKLIGSPEHTI